MKLRIELLALVLALATTRPAFAQDGSDSREADMFGESVVATASTAQSSTVGDEREKSSVSIAPAIATGATGDREGDMFGGAPMGEREVDQVLRKVNNILDIGAFFFLRAQYTAAEHGEPEKFPFSSPNILDVYLDGRPSDRVRAFTQARLNYNPTLAGREGQQVNAFFLGNKELQVVLDQLWLKFDLFHSVFITAGRQRIKWGSGRAWNPTDFLNQNVLNALDIFDIRTGVDLIKVHLPVESLGWNFYAISQFSGSANPQNVGGALRGEFVMGPAELALSGAVRKDRPIRLGADLSAGIAMFDFHAEFAVQNRVTRKFYRGTLAPEQFMFPESFQRADDWIPQFVFGGEVQLLYSDQDSVILGAEYFYNGSGYRDASLYPWLLVNNAFVPFYTGRHYAAVFALLSQPGSWNDTSFTLTGLSNLSDRSVVVRLDHSVLMLSYLRLNTFAQVHTGEHGEFRLGFKVPGLPLSPEDQTALGVPVAFQNGFQLDAPVLTIGLGLAIEI